jgi:flavin-dependent dehydrogenase
LAEIFTNAVSLDGIKGFSLPLGNKKRSISGHRYMLCGDAASLVDPFGGHGIDNAMWSGLIAAKQAIHCFKVGNFTADGMKQYDQKVFAKIGQRLSKGAFILKSIIRFPILIHVLSLLTKYQKLTRTLIKLMKI